MTNGKTFQITPMFYGVWIKLLMPFTTSDVASKGSDPSVCAFTVYAAGRGLNCVKVSTVTDASQRKPAAIPPTMARARESADLSRLFIA